VALRTAAALVIAIAAAVPFSPWLRGYALYHGYLSVYGRVAGHDGDLPAFASRCANCHDAARSTAAPRAIAPLTQASLAQSHSRRGGPETAFTETSFCSLLQDGIDPAYVMVERAMPHYKLSEASCHALWRYVSSR
jgi:hypothetical protein